MNKSIGCIKLFQDNRKWGPRRGRVPPSCACTSQLSQASVNISRKCMEREINIPSLHTAYIFIYVDLI